MNSELQPEDRSHTRNALQRVQSVSLALREAARRARISRRSLRAKGGQSYRERRAQAIAGRFMVLAFFVVFLVPSVLITSYYALFASNQFVSEAKFTVAGGLPPIIDKITQLTGIPTLLIVQDTLVVTNYLHSRAAVDALNPHGELVAAYSDPKLDWWSRFDKSQPIEKLVSYWNGMSGISIKMPAGIVDLQIRAFSPQKAQEITQSAIKICDNLINSMDDQILKDAVTNAEKQVASTTTKLAQTRAALEDARDKTGVLDPGKTAEAAVILMTEAKSGLLQLEQQYHSQIQTIKADAPQMLVLRARIQATNRQVMLLQDQITKGSLSPKDGIVLNSATTQLNQLGLENTISEKLYAGALAALEGARLAAEHKMLYLAIIEPATLPQQALYPQGTLMTLLISGGLLLLWGLLCSAAIFIRNKAS